MRFLADRAIEASARREVRFATHDRRDLVIARGVVKFHGAVHHAMVGKGNAGRTVLGRTATEAVDPARSVEERIFRVNVKMDETVQRDSLEEDLVPACRQPKVMGFGPRPA